MAESNIANQKSKISVITVCYNAESEIEKTILSVLNQNYNDIEYIIVDGKSKDKTIDVISRYRNKISKFISEKDDGLYDAMNKGIRIATGEWLCFMNAGDTFTNSYVLTNVFSEQIDSNVGVIYGDVELDYSNYGKVIKRMDNLHGRNQALDICHQSTFTRASILKKMEYDTSFKIVADMNTFYKIWKEGFAFVYKPICIASFEALGGVSSIKYINSFKERARVRGARWYNSIYWWNGIVRAYTKTIQRYLMTEESYNKQLVKRIVRQNEQV